MLADYYDRLTRFLGVARWFGRGGGHDALTVHRLLRSDDPAVPPEQVVHARILAALGAARVSRAIDAGCGSGGTVFYLHERLGGEWHGLTISKRQQARAAAEAARRGHSACRFHLHSYDDALTMAGPVDLVIAIESLAHARDPAHTIRNLAGALAPGGVMAVVDDMPTAQDDPDLAAFKSGWQCPALASRAAIIAALRDAGLTITVDEDMSALAPRRNPTVLRLLIVLNRVARALLPFAAARMVIDSLVGGLMLERLYARGMMQYRLIVARRSVP
jgi:SAM-dependent methyltransferase